MWEWAADGTDSQTHLMAGFHIGGIQHLRSIASVLEQRWSYNVRDELVYRLIISY